MPCVDSCQIKVLQIKGPASWTTVRTRSCLFPSTILDWQRISWTISEPSPLLSSSRSLFFFIRRIDTWPRLLFSSATYLAFIKVTDVVRNRIDYRLRITTLSASWLKLSLCLMSHYLKVVIKRTVCASLFLSIYQITSIDRLCIFNAFFVKIYLGRSLIRTQKNIKKKGKDCIRVCTYMRWKRCAVTIKIDAEKYSRYKSFSDNRHYNL